MAYIPGDNSDEVIYGTNSSDDIFSKGGDDTVYGLGGDDFLWSGSGNDIYDGGAGWDRVFYRNDPSGVHVDMSLGTATDGWGDTDTFINIERVTGSDFDDTLLGSSGNDSFTGELGDDLIDGRGGSDFVWYGRSPGAVNVDLQSGVVSGAEGSDTLISIESIGGSNYSDTLLGSSADNWFVPDQDDDIYSPHYTGPKGVEETISRRRTAQCPDGQRIASLDTT